VVMLYLVPTPVGNLEDMTPRAVKVLQEVDIILAEDTRVSGRLLKHFEISTKMRSYHAHNEHKIVSGIKELFREHKNIALITDAGTPAISDPGFLIVRACYEANISVTCLPGANAIIPALAMSGIPCDRFYFEGFLPQKKGRQTRWIFLAGLPCTIALYESTHRIKKLVKEATTHLHPHREIAVIKEISKLHETIYRGSVEEMPSLIEEANTKGEFVVIIGPEVSTKDA